MENETFTIIETIIVALAIIGLVATIIGGYYHTRALKIENFQNTIKDLSEEQKCMHICGFEWHGYFEAYKFCLEKCDRISERYETGQKG